MERYHKIKNVYKRDSENQSQLLEGQWTEPWMEALQDITWTLTEKVDGTNIRVMVYTDDEGEPRVKFAGRSDNAQLPGPLLERLHDLFPLELMRETFGVAAGPICLYGEGYGGKIQNGGGYRPDQDFILFDVRGFNSWLERDVIELLAESLGINIVPIVRHTTLRDAIQYVTNGFTSHVAIHHADRSGHRAEGLVAKPPVELRDRWGERIVIKIKCKDFAHALHQPG